MWDLLVRTDLHSAKSHEQGQAAGQAAPSDGHNAHFLLTKLTLKKMEGVIDALFNVACAELKKHNSFNFVNMVKLKLKPATLAKEGFHPTSKVPIVTRAKHLVIKGRVTRKFKLALANELECCWIR